MEEEVLQIREVQLAKRRRRLVAGGLAFLIVLPFLAALIYARATAIYLSNLEAQGEMIYHEGFEYMLLFMYSPFAVIGMIWSLAIFASVDHWPKSRLTWQALVIFFISGLPATIISAFFLFNTPF